jgi:phosphohistidine phosphatase
MPRFELLLMRHGLAEDHCPTGDAERALTQEGIARADRTGAAMRALELLPRVAVCSPLRRARQTSQRVLEACSVDLEPIVEPRLIPQSAPGSTLERLAEHAPAHGALLAVGHNPSVTAMLGALVCGDPGIHFAIAPGDLAHVSVAGERGVLRALWPAASVERIVDALGER